MVRRLGLGKNNHLTYASLALNPRFYGILSGSALIIWVLKSIKPKWHVYTVSSKMADTHTGSLAILILKRLKSTLVGIRPGREGTVKSSLPWKQGFFAFTTWGRGFYFEETIIRNSLKEEVAKHQFGQKYKRATKSDNLPSDKCTQRRLVSGCTLVQSSESSVGTFWIAKNIKISLYEKWGLIRLYGCTVWFESSLGAHQKVFSHVATQMNIARCIVI